MLCETLRGEFDQVFRIRASLRFGVLGQSDACLFAHILTVDPKTHWRSEHRVVGFVPYDAALCETLDLTGYNSHCNIYERRWFDQVHALYNPVRYALVYALAQDFNHRVPPRSTSSHT